MSLVFRTAGVLLTAGLAAAALTGALAPRSEQHIASAPSIAPLTSSPLPATDRAAGPALVERSPFSQNRSAFSRSAGPPAPEIEVRLAGIFKVGKQTRASLMVGGQPLIVSKGDETPVGIVSSIEASAVVLEGATTRRIEMFKQ